jgi:hypothetical protein
METKSDSRSGKEKTITPDSDPLKRRRQGAIAVVGGAIIVIVLKSLLHLSSRQINDNALEERNEVSSSRVSNMSGELHKINDTMLASAKSIDKSNLIGSLSVFEKQAALCSERQPLIDSIYGPIDRLLDKLSQPDNHSNEISFYEAILSNFRIQTEQSSELHRLVQALRKIKNAHNKKAAELNSTIQRHFRRLQIIDAELDQSVIDMRDAQHSN